MPYDNVRQRTERSSLAVCLNNKNGRLVDGAADKTRSEGANAGLLVRTDVNLKKTKERI